MKILLFTDNHFCMRSSIVQKQGPTHALRLENQIKSINWVETMAVENNCQAVVCLGDFFDKPFLNDAEITALQDIKWNNIQHYFIVGNHESTFQSLKYNSTKALESANRYIISASEKVVMPDCEICFLPYVTESEKRQLDDYFGKKDPTRKRLILSHNDLKGIQLGPVVSRYGFDLEEIADSCDLFINGHLHNGQKINSKVINLGNLTGKDFGEDASKYSHNIMIFDTNTFKFELIENPYAFNFYSISLNTASDLSCLDRLKNNTVLSISADRSLEEAVVNKVKELASKIVESRIIYHQLHTEQTNNVELEFNMKDNYLEEFCNFCKNKIEDTELLAEELAEICKA